MVEIRRVDLEDRGPTIPRHKHCIFCGASFPWREGAFCSPMCEEDFGKARRNHFFLWLAIILPLPLLMLLLLLGR